MNRQVCWRKNWLRAANPKSKICNPKLEKVFFSDDGSTALEVALKLAYEFTRRTRSEKSRPKFLSLEGAYHGDTVGAVSLGHIDLFHKRLFRPAVQDGQVMSPYCYRCPFNRAKPERDDARNIANATGNASAKLSRSFPRKRKKEIPTPRLFSSR